MEYLKLSDLIHSIDPKIVTQSLYIQNNRLKLRFKNTNEAFASIPASSELLAIQPKQVSHLIYENVTQSRTDYIDGKPTRSRKVDIVIDIHKETTPEALATLAYISASATSNEQLATLLHTHIVRRASILNIVKEIEDHYKYLCVTLGRY